MRVLLPALVLLCLVLFIAGLIAPRRARQMERKIAQPLRGAERKGQRNAGRFGDFLRASTKVARRALEKSAKAGRQLRQKVAR